MHIEQEEMVGSHQVEADSACPQRQEHDLGTPTNSVEVIHNVAAVLSGNLA